MTPLKTSFLSSRAIQVAPLLLALIVIIGCNEARTRNSLAPILLYSGTATSANDVTAFERLLKFRGLEYSKVSSDELNRFGQSELKTCRLLIVPGGHYINMGNGLSVDAAKNVREAVHDGLNYLGICAGGLLAGDAPCNSFNLTSGVRFDFYQVVKQGIHTSPVWLEIAGTTPQEHYWQDGPHFDGWGEVVARYPDETAAVVQGKYGQGWVVLCGVHPEAPQSWRTGLTFATPLRENHEFAVTLIEAALSGTSLPCH